LALHIHLDPVGGIAGDMFIAAMSDAFPGLKEHLESVLGIDEFAQTAVTWFPWKDRFLKGSAFKVRLSAAKGCHHYLFDSDDQREHARGQEHDLGCIHHEHQHEHQHKRHQQDGGKHEDHLQHTHRSYKEIRQILQAARLSERVREHALSIFRLIGEAEAEVHGAELESVEFHEVGGWDSVIDVVGAAAIIDWLGPATWSYSPLPVGGGYVECAHGLLPVPVPATALLLKGFEFRDDSVTGERVTPTGAAILKYVKPARQLPSGALSLKQVGYGFGTREFPNLSNVLRVIAYQTDVYELAGEPIAMLNFEVDDMTPEELAAGIERLRAVEGVFDVMQIAGTGKKGRMATSVQIIASPSVREKVATIVLNETTTLAVRYQTISRFLVPRIIEEIKGEKYNIRVKVASRPDGRQTAKVDIDDIKSSAAGCFERRSLALEAENLILKEKTKDESRS
jgi:pyridinium-3,5-bisthiocarboxylic acid mononucleotide nickel chelatase